MRYLLAPLGLVLGPVVGSLVYIYLRLLNAGRRAAILDHETARPVRWLVNARGLRRGVTITFGHRVYSNSRNPFAIALIRHELEHVRQYERHGWFGFLARYGMQLALYGYMDAPFEVDARRASHAP